MGNYIKGALKVLLGYCSALLIFIIFLITVISLAKESFSVWINIYSFAIFLLMFLIVYSEMKKLAIKEKRPQYNLKPYAAKGLVLGILGFLPLVLLEIACAFINLNDVLLNRIKYLILSALLGPVYFAVKLGGNTAMSYAAASALVPIVSMLGYMAGFYGFELKRNKILKSNNFKNINK